MNQTPWSETVARYCVVVLLLTGLTVSTTSAALVAHWEFENNLFDSTTNANHATDEGTTNVTYGSGVIGGAGSFDGSAYLSVEDDATLDLTTGMTISAWVRPTSISAPSDNVGIVFKRTNGNQPDFGPYELLMDSPAQYRTNVNGTSASALANGTVDFGVWQHVAATYDQSVLSLYKDGQLIASTSYSTPISTTNGRLLIGNRHSSNSHFLGLMDDVRVYNHALTSEEIGDLAAVPETSQIVALSFVGAVMGIARLVVSSRLVSWQRLRDV